MPTFGHPCERYFSFTIRHPPEVSLMSRRPLALLALSLVTLALSACADSTAPVASSQLKPAAKPNADLCVGGYLTSGGRC